MYSSTTKTAPRNLNHNRQSHSSKKQRATPNYNMFGGIVLAVAFTLILGAVGHADKQHDTMQAMQNACEAQPSSPSCQTLIKAVQSNPKLEVLSDTAGNFWVEEK